ncbi:hypothetical protein LUX33_06805 [Actinomadura madurae]|nr:hypothetical protein [Actinomadura madurae]MCP9948149.1 hypothetical protein [Actinomadura madurae]MCP9964921.1 hypothetical protein [Actinomadura madurae]
MLRLLGDLVVQVRQLGRPVRQRRGVLQETALQDVLELDRHLDHVGGLAQADAPALVGRPPPVPVVRAERILRGELPPRIGHLDRHLGVVPGDVLERLVLLLRRAPVEPVQQLAVRSDDIAHVFPFDVGSDLTAAPIFALTTRTRTKR